MSEQGTVYRTILPIPDQPHVGLTTYDAKDPDTKYPSIRELRPPEGAPNILIILLDDVGFGASSAFGGPCQTPNLEKLAANGLRYKRFHTTALCSPTRQALNTGRNHHSVGMGGITDCDIGPVAAQSCHLRARRLREPSSCVLDLRVRTMPRCR
jgi:arylsulfatase